MSEERIERVESDMRTRIRWAKENPEAAALRYGTPDRRNARNFLERYSPSATLKHQAEQIAKDCVPEDMQYTISETMMGDVLFHVIVEGIPQ